MNQNKVASILKTYGVINGIAGIILAIIIGSDLGGEIAFSFAAAVVVGSFGIYAFGEVIEILHDIRENTKSMGVSDKTLGQSFIATRNNKKVKSEHYNEKPLSSVGNTSKQDGQTSPKSEKTEQTSKESNTVEEAFFDTRRNGIGENIVCPKCGTSQRGNRNMCYNCALPFKYRDEI